MLTFIFLVPIIGPRTYKPLKHICSIEYRISRRKLKAESKYVSRYLKDQPALKRVAVKNCIERATHLQWQENMSHGPQEKKMWARESKMSSKRHIFSQREPKPKSIADFYCEAKISAPSAVGTVLCSVGQTLTLCAQEYTFL